MARTVTVLLFVISSISAAETNSNQWCPSDGLITKSDGTCLIILDFWLNTSHFDASSRCRSYSSYRDEFQLPTIKTPQKNAELVSWNQNHPRVIGRKYFELFLNLERESTSASNNLTVWRRRTDWRWRDGNSEVKDAVSESMWSMWHPTQPDNRLGYDFCVISQYVESESSTINQWTDEPCFYSTFKNSTIIICEKKPPLQTVSTSPVTVTSTTTSKGTLILPTATVQAASPTVSIRDGSPHSAMTTNGLSIVDDESNVANSTISTYECHAITSAPPVGVIAVLVIICVLIVVLFIVSLYFLFTAKRKLRQASSAAALIHYHAGSDNVD